MRKFAHLFHIFEILVTFVARCKRTAENNISENSSAGRASPCQGGGRGFESRFSLAKPRKIQFIGSFVSQPSAGKMLEWWNW